MSEQQASRWSTPRWSAKLPNATAFTSESKTTRFTAHARGTAAHRQLVDSPYLQINYDSGNAYVSGSDPDEMLKR